MKSFWCLVIVLSMLFLSVEGALDRAANGHAHQSDDASHLAQTDVADLDSSWDASDEDHCERCCHGHVPGGLAFNATTGIPPLVSDHQITNSPEVQSLAQAPPTPPPNA